MIGNPVHVFVQLGIDLDAADPTLDFGNFGVDTRVSITSTTYAVKYRI